MTKILIVSNTVFNLSDSNGRVLGLLLRGIPNESKMQFCIVGNSISPELINMSYRISDREALRGLFSRQIKATRLSFSSESQCVETKEKRIKRSATTMLIRDVVWSLVLSRTEFVKIAKEYNPDIILWQYGNSGFMAKLTSKLAQVCNAKTVVYSTEDYYFKTWNYMNKGKFSLVYYFFSKKVRSATKKVFRSTSLCICNTPSLANRFEKEFSCPVDVVMQSSSDMCSQVESGVIKKRIVYAGNMGLERPKALLSIAKALRNVDPEIVFEIYGRVDDDTKELFLQAQNIRYMGFVSYIEVLSIMRNSLLVIHAESFDDFYKRDLMAAFSTKIPDCLVSGTPLFIFAPKELAVTQYLEDNDCAFLCSNEDELVPCLREALINKEKRASVVEKAKRVASLNHNESKNQKVVSDLLNRVSTCN